MFQQLKTCRVFPRLIQAFSTSSVDVNHAVSKVGVVGGGQMAFAIVNGMLSMNLIDKQKLMICDPNKHRRHEFETLDIATTMNNREGITEADVILLAIKPQGAAKILMDIAPMVKPTTLVISILAGTPIDELQEQLGGKAAIVRAMPNTPAMIGEGATVWSKSNSVTDLQHELTEAILGSFGVQVYVEDENSLDMATALSGSGPAYFFLVAEAMVDTGVHMGFSRHVALQLVQQTMLGSAKYLKQSGKHPMLLRNDITSPGGTTAAALYRAEKSGFRSDIADAIWAAYERCKELGLPYVVERKRPRS